MADRSERAVSQCHFCDQLRRGLRPLSRLIRSVYRWIFARPSMQGLNEFILHLALYGRGYNNCCDHELTGEAYFVERLARLQPRLCLDVGANIGEYTQNLLARTGARVIAFEPLPKAFAALATLGDRYPGRLTVNNCGVGDRVATLDLYYGVDDSQLATFSPEVNAIGYVGAHNVNRMQVPVTTVDAYFAERSDEAEIDLLKIDTEGFEYEVLVGAAETLRHRPPKVVQIEYNSHQLFRNQSLHTLARLLPGYRVYQLLPHRAGMVLRDPALPEDNFFGFANFVFVRADVVI